MFDFRRTHTCGVLRKSDIGKQVTLSGWVHRRRDHGGLIFIDLRDRFGLTQLVFDPEKNPETHAQAEKLRSEWVISIKGEVIARRDGMGNPKMATGEVEIWVKELDILSKAKTPPFSVCDETIDVHEELRLKYRYLDLRRGALTHNLVVRHKAMMTIRRFLDQNGFIEITTPILGKSTPEGARDYLVPSRVYPGTFYALPQSPQIFKQLLMVGGMDRYFQIASCFRDEDLRADRQPEFSQVDLEMSFGTTEELYPIIEGLLTAVFEESLSLKVHRPFRRMTYEEAMEKYGTDKPDLRFGMELVTLNEIARSSGFTVFHEALDQGGVVKGFALKGGADLSRKAIDDYTAFVGRFGIRGLAWMKRGSEGLASSIVKFFEPGLQQHLIERLDVEEGDLIFMIADQKDKANQALDHLRREIAYDRGLIKPGQFEFLWVTDFPLFSWNHDEKRLESMHHPFTSPHFDDLGLLTTDPLKVRSSGYDIVLNGYEIGGGSQRIHNPDLQEQIFQALNLKPEEIEEKFGFFVDALRYGTPPHLGLALGLDRIVMLLNGTDNIRDVIAFPKTQKASDLMMECPNRVNMPQLKDLGITAVEAELSWTKSS